VLWLPDTIGTHVRDKIGWPFLNLCRRLFAARIFALELTEQTALAHDRSTEVEGRRGLRSAKRELKSHNENRT